MRRGNRRPRLGTGAAANLLPGDDSDQHYTPAPAPWNTCIECGHEWQPDIEEHDGARCYGCAQNRAQIFAHDRGLI